MIFMFTHLVASYRGNGFIPTTSRSLDRSALVCTLGATSHWPQMHGQCWVLLDGIRWIGWSDQQVMADLGWFGLELMIHSFQENTIHGSEIRLTSWCWQFIPWFPTGYIHPRWFSRRISEPSTVVFQTSCDLGGSTQFGAGTWSLGTFAGGRTSPAATKRWMLEEKLCCFHSDIGRVDVGM